MIATKWGRMSEQEFQAIEAKHRLSRIFQDQEDLNNERSGNNVGRISRFGLNKLNLDFVAQQKKDYQSLLDFLLSSAAYQEAYSQTMAALTETENLVYEKLLEASESLSVSEARLAEVLERARELPDGTKVFRGKNDNAFRADGTKVPASEMANINWREGDATVDEHRQAKQDRDGDKARFDQLSGFEIELSELRHKMKDTSSSPTLDELDQIKGRITEIHDQAEQINSSDIKMAVNKPEIENVPDLDFPTLSQ